MGFWPTYNKTKLIIILTLFFNQAGIPSIGFPPLEPYSQESSYFEYKNQQIHGSVHIKNGKTFGMTRAQIRDVRATADDDTFQLEVDVRFPKLISEGKFKGEGRFNAIKIVSKGFFNITFSEKIELILNFRKF